MPSAPPPEDIVSCYACKGPLAEPLVLCSCGCRLPLHPQCHGSLVQQRQACPVCRRVWMPHPQSCNQSVVSMPFTEAIIERPLTQTECTWSCETRWMVYSIVCLLIVTGTLFLFFYYIIK